MSEIPVHHGRCTIMRCNELAAGVLVLQHVPNPRDPQGDPIPWGTPVCGRHKAMAEAGLPWRWEPDGVEPHRGRIVMGDDFDNGGLFITDLEVLDQHADDVRPGGVRSVNVRAERMRGDGSTEAVVLFLTEELIRKLGSPRTRGRS